MNEWFTWQETRGRGSLRLVIHTTPCGRTHYRIFNVERPYLGSCLELEVMPNGRMFDYLRMDRFWGHVARPFGVYDELARTERNDGSGV